MAFAMALFVGLTLTPSGDAFGAEKTIIIAPLKYNGPPDSQYIKGAMDDMILSRVASGPLDAKKAKSSVATVKDALATAGKADYVFFGSISMLGSTISLDGQLVNVKDGSTVPLYVTEKGTDSLVVMADKIAKDINDSVRGVRLGTEEANASVEPTYNGKFQNTAEVIEVKKEDKIEEAKTPSILATAPKTEEKIQPSAEVTPDKLPTAPIIGGDSQSGVAVKVEKQESRGDFMFKLEKKKEFFTAIASADMDRDGVSEIIVTSQDKIYIYKYEDGTLKEVKSIKEKSSSDHLSISVLHDSDGYAKEVHIASLTNKSAASKILEFVDGDYKVTVRGIDYITKVVTSGGSEVLLGQQYRKNGGFVNKYVALKRDGDKVEESGEVELPKGYNLLALQIADFTGDRSDDITALNDQGYLMLFQRGPEGIEKTYEGSDRFGGSLHKSEFIRIGSVASARGDDFVAFDSGFKVYDTNGDGRPEIITRANEVAGGLLGAMLKRKRKFSSSTVLSMSYDGVNLTKDWQTKEMQGYISDFIIEDIDGDGKKDIIILSVPEGKLSRKTKSQIIGYRLF